MFKKINAQKLAPKINQILSHLKSERNQAILINRFSLGTSPRSTLQSLGDRFSITRERVRQITEVNLGFLRKTDAYKVIQPEAELIKEYLKKNSNVAAERKMVKDLLIDLNSKNQANFLFVLHLDKDFILSKENKLFNRYWSLSREDSIKARNVIEEIIAFLKKENQVLKEKNFLKLLNQDPSNSLNLSREIFVNFLRISKYIGHNDFMEWGLNEWEAVRPSGVREKAYLFLKHQGTPLHFREIAQGINQTQASGRKAHPGTLHNELIKDARFILVGRGLYALKEWGYKKGTVKEILINLLEQNKNILEKDELIKRVLKQRFVQRQTVMLALKSNEFEIAKNGLVKLRG